MDNPEASRSIQTFSVPYYSTVNRAELTKSHDLRNLEKNVLSILKYQQKWENSQCCSRPPRAMNVVTASLLCGSAADLETWDRIGSDLLTAVHRHPPQSMLPTECGCKEALPKTLIKYIGKIVSNWNTKQYRANSSWMSLHLTLSFDLVHKTAIPSLGSPEVPSHIYKMSWWKLKLSFADSVNLQLQQWRWDQWAPSLFFFFGNVHPKLEWYTAICDCSVWGYCYMCDCVIEFHVGNMQTRRCRMTLCHFKRISRQETYRMYCKCK